MGDILHALPAVTALRQAHPSWEIDWVVESRWSPLLAAEGSRGRDSANPSPMQPVVDRFYPVPIKVWGRNPLKRTTREEISALRRELGSINYEAVLDFQGAVRSAWIARMSRSKRVIGEAHPRERLASLLFHERIRTHGAHVIEQDMELASAVVGDDLAPVQPWLPVDPAATAWVDQLFASFGGQSAVLINPGAGWGAKRWPVERYAAVARGLIERGNRVLVNAGPGEECLAQVLAKHTEGQAILLGGQLSQLIAATRRIALTIAGDTGPLHLACALRRPVVGIYGPTAPSRNGPFGTRFKVLRSPDSRRDHTRREAPEAGLLTIDPKAVLQAADELLAAEPAL
ncbi:MAG TPA: glycosyltransferase family 9 protein [Terracidiphilus sp.]|nr:glycosyltransferase family 9 protein [Terracidiphilus sp.]